VNRPPNLEWFDDWFARHMARFPAYPWPPIESEQFAELLHAWLLHFRKQRVTEDMANRASLSLLGVVHYPLNHFAELLRCLPDPPVEYYTPDPGFYAHYKDSEAKRLRLIGERDGGKGA
jgi:hypothetical protein